VSRRRLVAAALVVVAPLVPLAARVGAQCKVAKLVEPVVVDETPSFGVAVALHDGVAVVGHSNAPFSAWPSWVFELQPSGWTAGTALPPGQAVTCYGDSVAVWGDTAVVAGEDLNDASVAASVFERVGGTWSQGVKLHAPEQLLQLSPGLSVAIEEDTILVADVHVSAAYVYERGAGGWALTQTLTPSGSIPAAFGFSASLRGGRAVIGGCFVSGSEFPGTAWVFERQGGAFVEVAQLVPGDADGDDSSGTVLAQAGDTIVLGAPNHDLGTAFSGLGAVHVFELVAGAWTETAFVTAPFPLLGDFFGASLALQDDLLVVGAPQRDGTLPSVGAAFAYRRAGAAWQHVATLQAQEPQAYGFFGASLAIDGDMLLVGAPASSTLVEDRVHVLRGVQGLTDWLPVGGGVAGGGSPCTFGTGEPAVGAPATVTLVGALPAQPGWLVLGVERINAPFKGGVLVPAPQLLVPLLTDAKGGKTFGWTWPPGLPPGLKLSLQHWIVDAGAPFGLAGGNALVVAVP